ncbi:MAG: hypothetical protein JKY33_07900 [Bacteroidia bacterium]|nr:hypothetical protein [Bacteroidia bacterium]
MKKILLLMFTVAIVTTVKAQLHVIKLEKVEIIKNATLIVGTSHDEAVNEALYDAVKQFWTIGKVGEPMPLAEAIKKAKEDESIIVITTGTTSSQSLTHEDGAGRYRYISTGHILELFGKSKKAMYKQIIPAFGEDDVITKEILYFGVSAMHYHLNTMNEKQLGTAKARGEYKIKSPELKKANLLLAEGWMDSKTTKETVGDYYTGKCEIVPYETWRNAILNREPGKAYSIIAPLALGGNYIYYHYLMEAKTGAVYAIASSKVAVSLRGLNLSKGNSGYINKKVLDKYSKTLEGKW